MSGKSVQDVCTPGDFIWAVEKRFGEIEWDLAATKENRVTREKFDRQYVGPGSEYGEDSLQSIWIGHKSVRWLNPPFCDISPWAAKCAKCSASPTWTLMLVPASAGTNWWAEYVHNKAMVYFLSPRLTFIGSATPYTKDLALCAYGYGVVGYTTWRWK